MEYWPTSPSPGNGLDPMGRGLNPSLVRSRCLVNVGMLWPLWLGAEGGTRPRPKTWKKVVKMGLGCSSIVAVEPFSIIGGAAGLILAAVAGDAPTTIQMSRRANLRGNAGELERAAM
ncbi:hypothetical protein ACLOJK_008691 [Asimina triloba]